jgi:hypothetical protein
MSYCTITEATSLVPTVGTLRDAVTGSTGPPVVAAVTATVPSATQGAAMLTAVEAEVSAHLIDKGFTLPVTDSDALAYLKSVAMNGVAARLAKAKWPTDSGPGGDGGAAVTLREDYAAGLAFIDSGGLSGGTSGETVGTSVSDGFYDSDGVRLAPQFTRDMEY